MTESKSLRNISFLLVDKISVVIKEKNKKFVKDFDNKIIKTIVHKSYSHLKMTAINESFIY